jgi:hypothetical protein
MNRKQRERLATIAAVLWRPFDRPEVPEEASSSREEALRRWRGQHETDEDDDAVKPPDIRKRSIAEY